MADILYDLLVSSTPLPSDRGARRLREADSVVLEYLASLASRPLATIESAEPQQLAQTSHSLLLSVQALSKRSHRSIIDSASGHYKLKTALPALAASTHDLKTAIPKLDNEAIRFSTTYHKSGDNEFLAARKRALLLSRNAERLTDVLGLPTLLSSAITSGSSTAASNYSLALDLNGHIRRLHSLYPESRLISSVSGQADEAMQAMAVNLISSLRAPSLKLASALRTISWLRRVMPDLDQATSPAGGGGLEALFLVCRLTTLMNMLAALEPLRELADHEKIRQQEHTTSNTSWSGGQQSERYLKRYIEMFREQSFAIVSMFKSIFPAAGSSLTSAPLGEKDTDPLQPLPSVLATFPLHLVEMLLETLQMYLPNVKDQASRESLLTQVLYCAGSLGRLGGDFGLLLASIDVGAEAEDEWSEVVKRHRIMAGRLASLVGSQERSDLELSAKA